MKANFFVICIWGITMLLWGEVAKGDMSKESKKREVKTEKEGSQPVSPLSQNRPLRVGVLDFNAVWERAKAPIQIRDDLQAKRREYQREIIALEEQLRKQEESLQREAETDSAESHKKRRKTFEAKVLAVQKKVQLHKQQLEKTFNKAMMQVSQRLNEIVTQISKSRNLDLVLSQTQVAFSNKELTITDQVIQELNTQLPAVKMDSL